MFLLSPCLKGRGPFITINYYLLQIYPQRDLHDQSVQIQESQLDTSMPFGPILEPSKPPSACIWTLGSRVGSQKGCLTRSFPRWRRLPSRSDEVDGPAYPDTSLRHIAICWGHRTSPQGATWSCRVGAYQEEEASRGIIIGWWLCPLLVHVHEISQGKWILTKRCLPPGKVMKLLGVLPR
jgi:hypothetical protein